MGAASESSRKGRVREYSFPEARQEKRTRANLTEDEEGQEYFLSQCQPYVAKDFLTYSDEEENPVWGTIIQYVRAHPQADEMIGTNEELFEFLRPCFTSSVLQRINEALIDSALSSLRVLGPALLKRGNYFTFVKALVTDIIDEISDAQEGEGSSSQEAGWSSLQDVVHGETNRQKLPALYDVGNPAGGGAEDAPGDPPGGWGDDPIGKFYFQRANDRRRKVIIEAFDTPPRPRKAIEGKPDPEEIQRRVCLAGERTKTIRSRSVEFCEKVKLLYDGLPSPEYQPGKQSAHDSVFIFHGTRVKHLQSFADFGIWIGESHRSDFSRDKTFYLSNSFRYAYEHVLLNVMRHFHDNYVMVYCFLVPFGELEGIVESESAQKLDRKKFFDGNAEWKAFLKHNWETKGVLPSSSTKDIIIGPIGVSEWIGLGSKREQTFKPVTWENGEMPFQLAFNTLESWTWLARHLKYCYEESRR